MRKYLSTFLLALVCCLFACTPRMMGSMIMAAAIVGTVAVLAHHDAHFHDEYCGHHRRWNEDHWVYYYEERWEYYDPASGRWYYYEEY